MTNQSYSELLHELSRNYYNRSIGIADYRAQRKHILDTIDSQYNGVEIDGMESASAVQGDDEGMSTVFYGPTDTQPNFRK